MNWSNCLLRSTLGVKIAVASLLFFAMTAFKTYPLMLHFNTHIPSDLGDPLLNTWIMAWDFHSLATAPWNLFHANILYPAENTLAFSEHLLGVLPLFAPPYALTGNPILAHNVVFSLSFALSGVAMFLLVHHWTQAFWASLVSGVLFAFAPIRFSQVGHLQLLNLYWTPIALLFLDRFLRRKRWADLAGFSVFYWLQVLSSVYLGWFTTIAVAMYVLYDALFIHKDLLSRSMIPRYATFAAASVFVLLPFHLPYYAAKVQWGFSRNLNECLSFSADLLLSYLNPSFLMNDLYLSLLRFARSGYGSHEKSLFPGFVMAMLVAFGSFAHGGSPASDKLGQMKRVFWLIAAASFILSLGPYLVVLDRNTSIPLPYLLLYHGLPGFQAMRVPARFGFMVVSAVSVLAALGFLRASTYLNALPGFRRLRPSACQAVVALSCLGLFALELGFKPLPLVEIETGYQVPAVYRWLAAGQLHGPIVELPFGQGEDYRYTYFSTYHWLPLVNGRTGFAPPTYLQIISELDALPSRKAVESLSAIGVQGLVVHTDWLLPHEVLRWDPSQLADMGLEKVAAFDADVVYKILPSESTHRLRVEVAVPHRLRVGKKVRLGLLARGIDHRAWTHPRPLGRMSAIVEWEEQRSGRIAMQKETSEFPLVIRAEETSIIDLLVHTPSAPGRYKLKLYFPSFDISTEPMVVDLQREPFPTSLDSPQLLSATYDLEGTLPHAVVSWPFDISLQVVNTGEVVWLASAKGDKGSVRLGWRWFKGDQELLALSSREPLRYDVFPGQAYQFKARLTAPTDPGEYVLELGLVSELVTWFSEQGVGPLKVTVSVDNSLTKDFERLLAKRVKAVGDPPRLTIATDRAQFRGGDVHTLTVDIVNSGRSRPIDAYLVLVWPDGKVTFWDGKEFLSYTGRAWIPLARRIELAEGGRVRNAPLLSLKRTDMPGGSYTWYLVLTEPNTYNVIATAQATFALEP